MAGFEIDRYSLQARALPMFLALLPAATCVAAWTPGILSLATGLGGAGVVAGASFFLAQLARNAGKRREQALWTSWGGAPTIRFLRHRDRAFNQHQRTRCHKVLRQLGEHVPSEDEERDDPMAADQSYESCTKRLIAKTRDQQRFPLLFRENINYGFWRNLWALKPLGLTMSLVATGLCALQTWLTWRATSSLAEAAVVGGIVDAFLAACWIGCVSPDAVHLPARAYAERLLESCNELEQEATRP